MAGEIKSTTQHQHQYPQQYLDEITKYQLQPMDSKGNGGNGDGKTSIGEALNNFSKLTNFMRNDGYFTSKQSKENFENAVSKLPEALVKYAGDDKYFSAQEMAEFINGSEWNEVLSSRPFNFPWHYM